MFRYVHYPDTARLCRRGQNVREGLRRAQILVAIPWVVVTGLLRLNVISITAERFMLQWQARTNPPAWCGGSLTLVSAANILAWFMLYRAFYPTSAGRISGGSDIGLMFLLCAGY